MIKIGIIGCGSLGLRHLQSILNLNFSKFEIFVVEPFKKSQVIANEFILDLYPDKAHFVQWFHEIEQLPNFMHLAIIATTSSIRFSVLSRMLSCVKIDCLILEKILFNQLDQYKNGSVLVHELSKKSYVNCPLRLWPIFKSIKNSIDFNKITSVEIISHGEDLGCNGIHFIDLMSFWTNSTSFNVYDFDIQSAMPSKREGYLKINAKWGACFQSDSGHYDLLLDFQLGDFKGAKIYFYSGKNKVLELDWSNGHVKSSGMLNELLPSRLWNTPFQSELTSQYVLNFIDKKEIGLPNYDQSAAMHVTFLNSIVDALRKTNVDVEDGICPIT